MRAIAANGEEVGQKIDASMVLLWYKHFSNSRTSSKENIASMTREGVYPRMLKAMTGGLSRSLGHHEGS